MRFNTNLLAGLLLTGVLALAPANSFARGEVGEVAVATVEGFTAGLAPVESGLWCMDSTDRTRKGAVVMMHLVMMALDRIIGTLGITGISVRLIMGSTTIPARTMTMAAPWMCNRHRMM